MINKIDIIKYALVNSLFTILYIILVAVFLSNASQIFGQGDTILAPIVMLLLFVFSATLCGALVLGRPLLWYLDGKKKEAISLFAYTVSIFFVVMVLVFVTIYITSQ